MKFKQNVLTKRVMYRGVEVECPANHFYVATDPDGYVYSYEDTPLFIESLGCWMIGDDLSLQYTHIGFSDEISEEDSLNSLQEI